MARPGAKAQFMAEPFPGALKRSFPRMNAGLPPLVLQDGAGAAELDVLTKETILEVDQRGAI